MNYHLQTLKAQTCIVSNKKIQFIIHHYNIN